MSTPASTPASSAEATGAPAPDGLPRTIVLVRHGPVDDGGLCYGARVSPPLAEEAPGRIAELRPRLSPTFSRVISSPATRCLETTRLLDLTDHDVDARWIERDFGDWEGRPWSEVWTEVGDVQDAAGFAAHTPMGGEAWPDVVARVGAALDELAAAPTTAGDPPVAVVTHGGVIRCALAHVLGISIGTALLFDPAPASATWLTSWGGTWTVARVGA